MLKFSCKLPGSELFSLGIAPKRRQTGEAEKDLCLDLQSGGFVRRI